MRIAVDAMSGDLGSAPVVEACRNFASEHRDATLVVVGKMEELESYVHYYNKKKESMFCVRNVIV